MTDDQEVTRYLTLIEYYKEQINSVEYQMQYVQFALAEYNKAKLTIESLQNTEHTTEMMVPIGGGTFLPASCSNTKSVLFDIGAGYVMEKSNKDAIKKIDKRIEELQRNQEHLQSMMQKLQTEVSEISQKAQELMGNR